MHPIQFLTGQEIESAYLRASKSLPIPSVTDDHRRHLIACMIRENSERMAKSIVGRMNGEEGWSRINLDKDAKAKISAWQESERWRLWLASIGATFCDKRQKWIVTNSPTF